MLRRVRWGNDTAEEKKESTRAFRVRNDGRGCAKVDTEELQQRDSRRQPGETCLPLRGVVRRGGLGCALQGGISFSVERQSARWPWRP